MIYETVKFDRYITETKLAVCLKTEQYGKIWFPKSWCANWSRSSVDVNYRMLQKKLAGR